MTTKRFTAIIQQEDDWFVSLCPELDVASQGKTVEESVTNLKEAVELFLETASAQEIAGRIHQNTFVTQFEAAVG